MTMRMVHIVHVDDNSSCRATTGVPPRCIDHGRLVKLLPLEMGNIGDLVDRATRAEYVQRLEQVVEEQAVAAGVPLELLPEEHETSGFAFRLQALKLDIMRAAHEAAARHGFDKLDVDISVRVPPQPEFIEVTMVQAKPDLRGEDDEELLRALQRVPAAEHEALARQVVMAEVGNLRMVGWYCAGGHVVEHFRGHAPRSPDPQELATPSIRLEDPCAYGVPVYRVERLVEPERPAWKPPVMGDCEGCGAGASSCFAAMADVEGRPCCRECEHRS